MIPTWVRPWMGWAIALAAVLGLLAWQSVRLADARTTISERNATISKMNADHAAALLVEAGKARATENDLRGAMDQVQADAAKEKSDAKSREDALLDRVRTGERRLSIAVRVPTGGCASTGANPVSAAGGGSGVSRAELDPAAAERIVRIARDGDEAIIERNACVVAYRKVEQILNAAADAASAAGR